MDDAQYSCLTSQFGQCSQELINLALTGEAVSNVFDNILTLYDGSVKCRGISSHVHIGYLTQLEALRYCQVGSFFKSPQFPIWIVGSQSHFSVLFSTNYDLFKESSSHALLDTCRRAFLAVPSAEENGFIPSSSLSNVLTELGLFDTLRDQENIGVNIKTTQSITLNDAEKESLITHLEVIYLFSLFLSAYNLANTASPGLTAHFVHFYNVLLIDSWRRHYCVGRFLESYKSFDDWSVTEKYYTKKRKFVCDRY